MAHARPRRLQCSDKVRQGHSAPSSHPRPRRPRCCRHRLRVCRLLAPLGPLPLLLLITPSLLGCGSGGEIADAQHFGAAEALGPPVWRGRALEVTVLEGNMRRCPCTISQVKDMPIVEGPFLFLSGQGLDVICIEHSPLLPHARPPSPT